MNRFGDDLFITFRCQHGPDPLLVRELVEEVLSPGEVRLRQPPEDGAGVVVVHVIVDLITLLSADEEMPAELGELAEGQPLVGIVVEAVQGPGSAMSFGESFILALLDSFVHVYWARNKCLQNVISTTQAVPGRLLV